MRFGERILHAILFEGGALLVAVAFVVLTGMGSGHTGFALSITMSLMAMIWTVIFNWIFDKFFTGPRELRDFRVRSLHTLGFEISLIAGTAPVIAAMLDLSLWQALLADLSLTSILVVYSFTFNWLYDHLRLHFVQQNEDGLTA